MKIIIDIPENVLTAIQNGEDYRYDIHTSIAQGIPYEEKPKYFPPCEDCNKKMEDIRQAYDKMKARESSQGEREFIEIFAEYVPDDICTYPEYRGKPYYSIHYTQNGEDFVGFGTYSPKVLSRYLREYFFEQKGGAE